VRRHRTQVGRPKIKEKGKERLEAEQQICTARKFESIRPEREG
jgi:hypothetical protein